MTFSEDRWLSDVFGYPVYRVEGAGSFVSPGQAEAFYYTKVDTSDVETLRRRWAEGFYVVDVNVTFGLEPKAVLPDFRLNGNSGPCTVVRASAEHEAAILQMAGSCFQYSRFHLDPLIPKAVAHQIKRNWILSYLKKQRGEALWVALMENRCVGFLAVLAQEFQGRRSWVIDLVGVERTLQRRGIGFALVSFFIEQYRKQGELLQVGTQVANVPSMRLYEKMGFSIQKSQYVLHLHVGSPVLASPGGGSR